MHRHAVSTAGAVSLSVGLWLLASGLPTAPVTLFDGLPWSSAAEAVALILVLPLVAAGSLRRLAARSLQRASPWAARGMFAGAALALVLKAALLPVEPTGFLACYRSTLSAPPAGECERSFENAPFRFGATRVDSALDFGPDAWNLSYVNSLRFNFFAWEPGNRRFDRLPFVAQWRGRIDPRGRELLVSYIGEGSLALGNRTFALTPAYEGVSTMTVPVPEGEIGLRVLFLYDDRSSTESKTLPGPYATFRLQQIGPDGRVEGLPPAPSRPAVRLAGTLIDALGLVGTAGLLAWYGYQLRRHRFELLIIAAAAALAAGLYRFADIQPSTGFSLVSVAILAAVLARRSSARLLLAYFAVVVTAAALLPFRYAALKEVIQRRPGDDFLTYESQARTILETWSLEGGESVFYVQPFFRYIRFAERFFLGDGDPLVSLAGCAALIWCVIYAASTLQPDARAGGLRRILFAVAAGLTVWLASSPTVITMIDLSTSEHVTWILTAAAFGLLARQGRTASVVVGAACLGAALITRPNQAPGLTIIAAALLVMHPRRRSVLGAAVFMAVALLPLAHNVHYGGRAVLFTTTYDNPAALGVPIRSILNAPRDPAARHAVLEQARWLLFSPPQPAPALGGPQVSNVSHAILAVWILALGLSWLWTLPPATRILALAPAAFLAVHIAYDVVVYYPRHILAGYFAMGEVTMALAGRPFTRAEPTP